MVNELQQTNLRKRRTNVAIRKTEKIISDHFTKTLLLSYTP